MKSNLVTDINDIWIYMGYRYTYMLCLGASQAQYMQILVLEFSLGACSATTHVVLKKSF